MNPPKMLGVLIDDGSDDALHGAELRVEAEEHEHEEEEAAPEGGEGHLASLCSLLIFPLLQTPSTSSRAAAEQQRSPRQQGRERRPAVLTPSSQLTPPPAWRGKCRTRRTSSSSIVKIYEFSA